MNISALTLRAMLHRFALERGPDRTFCPSEVPRALAADWRPLMPPLRAAVARLVAKDRLRCTQRGVAVAPLTARGPIRLSLPR